MLWTDTCVVGTFRFQATGRFFGRPEFTGDYMRKQAIRSFGQPKVIDGKMERLISK